MPPTIAIDSPGPRRLRFPSRAPRLTAERAPLVLSAPARANTSTVGEIGITRSILWMHGANPGTIEVPGSEWTRFSTVPVFPGARENEVNDCPDARISAWIDRITLTPVDGIPADDTIFANGFEGS